MAVAVPFESDLVWAVCSVAAHPGGKDLAACAERSSCGAYRGSGAGAPCRNIELLQRSVPGTASRGHLCVWPSVASLCRNCGVRGHLLPGLVAGGRIEQLSGNF